MAFVSWSVILCQCIWYKLFDPGDLPNTSQDLDWCMNKHFSFSWVNSPAQDGGNESEAVFRNHISSVTQVFLSCLLPLKLLEKEVWKRRLFTLRSCIFWNRSASGEASLSACFIKVLKVLPCATSACFPSGPEEENQLFARGAKMQAGSEAQQFEGVDSITVCFLTQQ